MSVDFSRPGRRIRINGRMVLPAEVEDLIASLRLQIATLEAKVAELQPAIGAGQFQQFQAAFERWVEEEASRCRQPARPLGQGERRAEGPQGIRCGKSPIRIG